MPSPWSWLSRVLGRPEAALETETPASESAPLSDPSDDPQSDPAPGLDPVPADEGFVLPPLMPLASTRPPLEDPSHPWDAAPDVTTAVRAFFRAHFSVGVSMPINSQPHRNGRTALAGEVATWYMASEQPAPTWTQPRPNRPKEPTAEPRYLNNTADQWMGLFRSLGEQGTRALLDVLSHPDALAFSRPLREIAPYLARSTPPRPAPDDTAPDSTKKPRRRRRPIVIADPRWDRIYHATDHVLLAARLHRTYEYTVRPTGDHVIHIGGALRFRTTATAPEVLSETWDPLAGVWRSVDLPGLSKAHEAPDDPLRLRELSPTTWPIGAANGSSSAERDCLMVIDRVRDALTRRQEEIDPSFALDARHRATMRLADKHPFPRSAERVRLVLTAKWRREASSRHHGRGPAVKAWWDHFVPRDALAALVAVNGSARSKELSWLELASFSRRPDRAAIQNTLKTLGPERSRLANRPFDTWAAASVDTLINWNAPLRAPWRARWSELADLPSTAGALLAQEIMALSDVQYLSAVPLVGLPNLPIAPPPIALQDEAALHDTNPGEKRSRHTWSASGGPFSDDAFDDSNVWSVSDRHLPFDEAARTRLLRTAEALVAGVGITSCATLWHVSDDVRAAAPKCPPRQWEMTLSLGGQTWRKIVRRAAGVPASFEETPLSAQGVTDHQGDEVVHLRRALVDGALHFARVWSQAHADRYRVWNASDQEKFRHALGQWLNHAANVLRDRPAAAAADLPLSTVVINSLGVWRDAIPEVKAVHERLVLAALIPKRGRGRPRKVRPADAPASTAAAPARRRM